MRSLDRSGAGCGGRRFVPSSLWAVKMRHGQGGGGLFSRRGGGFGGGDDDFSRGRKFSSDDLQVLLVALLVDEPRHGYELIRLLETRSNGFYTPSPGMVYPALTYLEEIGHTTVAVDGNRKRYALTDQGACIRRIQSRKNRAHLGQTEFFSRRRWAWYGARWPVMRPRSGTHHLKELMEAGFKLKQLLIARSHASSEEQLRIARVLERAAAEITAGAGKNPKNLKDED